MNIASRRKENYEMKIIFRKSELSLRPKKNLRA